MIIPDCCFFICSEIVMKYILQIFRAFEANRTNNHLKYRSILNCGTISMSWTSFGTFGKLGFNVTFCFFTQSNSIVQMDHYHGDPATKDNSSSSTQFKNPKIPSFCYSSFTTKFDHNVWPQCLTTKFDHLLESGISRDADFRIHNTGQVYRSTC